MIKARGDVDGRPLLLLGLSRANVERLQADQPIRVTLADMAELGLPALTIVICAGETEAAIAEQLGVLPLQPEVAGQRFTVHPDGS